MWEGKHIMSKVHDKGTSNRVPKFKHDCSECVLIRQSNTEDTYICEKEKFIEIVIRYGDDGPDYWSSAYFKRKG